MRHYNIKIKGKVQGVAYRFNAQAQAHKFNLTGFVRNLNDGSVYCEVEGTDENIAKFIDWCYVGSRLANVSEVNSEESALIGYQTFEVKK